MSGEPLLDWAVMSVSLFNTIILLWLGLTVLLNAERRTWGVWLASGGLLAGGVFFLSHSAILGYEADIFNRAVDFWWHFGWLPLIIAPFAWYLIILWYTGYWEGAGNRVYRRHRIWFTLLLLVSVAFISLFLFSNPLPSIWQLGLRDLDASPAILGYPLLILLYPPFILACIGLSLDALIRPGPTMRLMGQVARKRARPWLIAASFLLLLVSLLVGWVILSLLPTSLYEPSPTSLLGIIMRFDLLIASLIGISVFLMGQAIISYEVFTGKTLPRKGLQRLWQVSLVLAASFSSLGSLVFNLNRPPIYILLFSICLVIGIYAWVGWRSFLDRQAYTTSLRPFITSQQFYDQLQNPTHLESKDASRSFFDTLCEKVLNTRQAHLIPRGPLAPFFDGVLAYPPNQPLPSISLVEIVEAAAPQSLIIPLDRYPDDAMNIAVPLWNAGGLCGLLLLGSKQDRGLYSQEEIEIARTSCERWMDIQAGAEMSRRLMDLQRRQLAESQLLDQHTRRTLHDEVLPLLHAAMLSLERNQPAHLPILEQLGQAHRQIADILQDMPPTTQPQIRSLGLIGALKQVLDGELKDSFEQVDWHISSQVKENLRRFSPLASEALFYAVRETMRNAARHARPADSGLHLTVNMSWDDRLEIRITDDGIGMENSRSEGKSGHGLALHSTMLAVLGGSLSVESVAGASTCIRLFLPLSPNQTTPPPAGY